MRVQFEAGTVDVGEEAGVAMYRDEANDTECPRSWLRTSDAPPEYSFDDVPTEKQVCPEGSVTVVYEEGVDELTVRYTSADESLHAEGTLQRADE